MTRIITAVVLVLMVISGCVAGELTVHYCDGKIGTAINNADSLALSGDISGAQKAAKSIEAEFAACEGALAVFINHSLVEELGSQIAKLSRLATDETRDEFLSELASARVMLIHIVRDNHPTWLNIL